MLLFGPVDGPKAQQNTGTSSRPPVLPDPLAPMGPEHGQAERDKMLKAVQEDRQKKLVSDTEKLLALATALHADVAKTDRNILSMDVIRRADEIERLAHSVKERMKG
jgi:hypothetical protein